MEKMHQVDGPMLFRYVSGTGSEGDRRVVESWCVQDPGRRAAIEEMKRIWTRAGVSVPEQDLDTAWRRLQERLPADLPADPRAGRGDRPPRRRLRAAASYPVRVAASLVLVVALVFGAHRLDWLASPAAEAPTPASRTYRTTKGQRAMVTLTDGTLVHLNVGSTLTVPGDFGDGGRSVRLRGEAFFRVARDEARAFDVHTDQGTIQVLGTVFDIRSYAEEDRMHVAVAEGRVAVLPGAAAAADTVQLRPRDIAFIAHERLDRVRREVDLSAYLAWTEGRLVFRDTPFREVMKRLAQWYNLDIEVAAPPESVSTFNGAFRDEPLSEILNTVSIALGLKYCREQRHITFYPAGPGGPVGEGGSWEERRPNQCL